MDINIFTNGLDINDALDLLGPVAVYILGIIVYSIFVFKFYLFVASRDMFELNIARYSGSRFRGAHVLYQFSFYALKYIILFPAAAFFWFAVLALILTFLSKEQPFSEILLMALATVSAIRIAAYYNEDLSRDLSKILPFAVLAIFLIDASFFSISESLDTLKEAEDNTENILYYLAFLVVLEFVLRLIMGGVMLISNIKDRILKRDDPAPKP